MLCFTLTIVLFSATIAFAQNNTESVVSANNNAAVDIYKTLKDTSKTNIICSPLSLSAVLSLLLAGANDTTYTEISSALGYSNLTQDMINSGYHDLLKSLTGSTDFDLTIANSIWLSKTIVALPGYITTVTEDYYSEVNSLNTSDPAGQINTWVNGKTKGLIPVLFDKLDSDVLMVLVNAIYFKGVWVTAFKTSDTKTLPFVSKTGTTQIPQMHLISQFNYYDSSALDAQVLELPYKGDSVSLIVILPKANNGFDTLEKNFKYSDLSSALDSMSVQKVDVTLPKFKIESSFPLNKPLMDLGIQQAFTDNAQFSGISQTALKISTAIQKAFIEVDEKGTKAAAATGIGMAETTSFNPQPVKIIVFNANHPFLFALRHKTSKSVLFWGRYISS